MKTITKVDVAPGGPIADLFRYAREIHHHVWLLQLTTNPNHRPRLIAAATDLDARIVAADTDHANNELDTAAFWLHPDYSTCEMIPCEPAQ